MNCQISGAVAIALMVLLGPSAARAQAAGASVGAAEKAGKGWPYPEPAQRGSTGFSPDYSVFTGAKERWDIYVNILWRKTGSARKFDLDYYDDELAQFIGSVPTTVQANIRSAVHLPLIMEQVRANLLTLPYRDPKTRCLLFMVKHDQRMDMAADDCAPSP
jgi:hypothetical protein